MTIACQRLRDEMPVCQRWAYFDHAATAPVTRPASEAIISYARQSLAEGVTCWPTWSRRVDEVRATAARLIGADLNETALIRNTTEGINLVANGLAWRAGDNVVTLSDEFPSNQYPWLNLQSQGVEVRRLPTKHGAIEPDTIAAACDPRTRIVSISWVGYAAGYRHDLAAVAAAVHGRGALLFVDAIQGLGAFPLDVGATPIDFLAADGHKWMLGPEGAGIFFVRQRNLEVLRPLGVGWNSVVQAHDFSDIELRLKPTAERYEGGTPNMPGFHGLGASLELLEQIGVDVIGGHILAIVDEACWRLEALGATIVSNREERCRSGIVSFELPGPDPRRIRADCLAEGVVLSCRAGRLRISPHAYNNEDDLDRLFAALQKCRGA